eukprot:TRINITY_DN62907_c0_g1_i1.p1 TRINITY_DN62907_c0_g1~~TRINITY_DN62907_c0_g1_i1.p1  ORF type:complete len:238 (-),score=42.09 TRINITY_DN62907_c0_g1_i1:67-696(-)
MLQIHFNVDAVSTVPGDVVWIVGSSPELGAWSVDSAVPCVFTAGRWASPAISFDPATKSFEFKCIRKNGDQVTWEECENKQVKMGFRDAGVSSMFSVQTNWGMPRVQTGEVQGGIGHVGEAEVAGGGAFMSGGSMPRVDTGMHPLMQAAMLEGTGSVDFEDLQFNPIVLDGEELNPTSVRGMDEAGLHNLLVRLEPVVNAARQLLEARR